MVISGEYCWCDIHVKAYVCEKWQLKIVDAPKGRFLEFFISWPPCWGTMKVRISGQQADIAYNELKLGVLYVFRGKLDWAKTNRSWVMSVISWDKCIGSKQRYNGPVRKKNKYKLTNEKEETPEEPQEFLRKPPKKDYLDF